jgi:hypothetical protein
VFARPDEIWVGEQFNYGEQPDKIIMIALIDK